MFAAIIILAAIALAGLWPQHSKGTTTTYIFDPVEEQWVKTVVDVSLPPNPDGSQPRGSHTIIIRLSEDNPIKTIWIQEVLVIGDSSSSPLLEIDGDSNSSGSSSIQIGTLLLQHLDAEELEIHDTKVVSMALENVVAEDDELDIDVEIVNVIGSGRGGASTLFIGVSRQTLRGRIDDLFTLGDLDPGISSDETGLRVDRIRILGPSSGRGFIENLIIRRSAVFGKIEIKDVEIRNLFLDDVTLGDLSSGGG